MKTQEFSFDYYNAMFVFIKNKNIVSIDRFYLCCVFKE